MTTPIETSTLCNEALIACCRAAGSLIEELAATSPEVVHRVDRAIGGGAAGLLLRVDLSSGYIELRVKAGDEEKALVRFEADRPARN